MREILFKAKRVDNGEWVEGSIDFSRQNRLGAVLMRNHDLDNYWVSKKVIPETVCQYTGLRDKNGQRIFEGDEVVCSNRHVGFINWEDNDACWNVSDYYDRFADYPTMATFEGQPFEKTGLNIHDTTEATE